MEVGTIFVGVLLVIIAGIGYSVYRVWEDKKALDDAYEELEELEEFNEQRRILEDAQYFNHARDNIPNIPNTAMRINPAETQKKVETPAAPVRNVTSNFASPTDLVDSTDCVQPFLYEINVPAMPEIPQIHEIRNSEEVVERVALRNVDDVSAGTTEYRSYTPSVTVEPVEVRVTNAYVAPVETSYSYKSTDDTSYSSSSNSGDSGGSSSSYSD